MAKQKKPGHKARGIALGFYLAALGWIFISDALVGQYSRTPETFRWAVQLKDSAALTLAALALYFLLTRYFKAPAEEPAPATAPASPPPQPLAERNLRMVTACHHALLHAKDETTLLQEICQVAVQQGGYRMAWVGYPNYDEAKSFQVKASAGHVAGYLDALQVTWDGNRPEGRGPLGTTFRARTVTVFNNHEQEERFHPWRTAALARGYQASAGLPLKDGDQCF
ncbi:MAG TPA: GAF domain-containing protein, partial [Verrucomicrobiae bacterium]